MKIDPYRSRERYMRWRTKIAAGIPGLTDTNSRILQKYLNDMELGVNIGKGTKRGARSYLRLNTLRARLVFLARLFEQRYGVGCMTEVTEEQAHSLFMGMRSGEIRKRNGGIYASTGDYVKAFRAFWHWHMKVQRKQGKSVSDVCFDLDDRNQKARWVYLTEQQVQLLCRHAKYKYRVLMLFLFDSGIRSPTELVNVRVRDLSQDCRKLHITDEASKTFGRTINLLLSGRLLEEYVNAENLRGDDQVFAIRPAIANKYLRRLSRRVLGNAESAAGSTFGSLTMYDFRHSSACYWLPRYKSESALKYRFGWKRSEMIHYYTEFLGMRDTVTEEDLLLDGEKTAMERRVVQAEQEKRLLREELDAMRAEMKEILGVVERVVQKVG